MISNISDNSQLPLTEISSERHRQFKMGELWKYRELLFFFLWRDIKLRYQQTLLGVLWVGLQPLCTLLVFSVFFGKFMPNQSESVPYPVLAFAGLIPWYFFANSFSAGSNSLVGEGALIKKVYFPRLLIPLAKVSVGLLDFAIGSVLLFCVMIYYSMPITERLLFFPIAVLFMYLATIGITILFAAMNVLFRDIKHLVPFMIQIGLFVSPVVYSSSLIPDKWQPFYAINPLVGVIELFRWIAIGTFSISFTGFVLSLVSCIILLFLGGLYFSSAEEQFADVV